MSYSKWFEQHALKHAAIMEKLQNKTDDDIIAYFDFENMKEKEFDFCPLYAKNKKCHDIEKLNCYLCACPNFRFNDEGFKEVDEKTLFSYCDIESVDGKKYIGDGIIHQNCAGCFVPHNVEYIKANFNRNWREIMKSVLPIR